MYTAHYDHLGFVPGMAGDNIYNGAADNGTGCGMIAGDGAGVGAVRGVKLPHSVIFAAVTAEEQGLLGSEYLGQHPPIPAGQIALDINYDMILPIGVPQEVNVNGAQRTSFLSDGGGDGEAVRAGDRSGSAAGGGKLLSLGPLQPVAGGDSGVLD